MPRPGSNMSRHLLVLPLLLLISLDLRAETVDHWLDKMMQGMTVNNYRGTLVIRQADQLEALRVTHGYNEQGNWEILESLSGEPRQVIRKDNQVTTIFPARKLVTISQDMVHSPLHPQLPENRELLKQHYDIRLDSMARIAGKQAQILEIMPKDEYRYGFKFWLENETGLLLKCDMVDAERKIIEQLMFSDLEFLEQPPAVNTPGHEGFQVIDLDRERQPQTTNEWHARQLPQGFMLTQNSIKPSFHGEGIVHHLVYSDGMASVSVFVEKLVADKMPLNGISRMGALNAFGQSINEHHITVIGEVPVSTVKLIGESFIHSEKSPEQE
ncbi:MAG: hypothetical protein EP315_05590 [Gammaproteobacteria bacterium]|nr:MAG: hypothetical protein EP315_05590 [Gammaproteobacteria bacterium]